MVGYGPEDNHFVAELTYNYGVGEYQLGNDFMVGERCGDLCSTTSGTENIRNHLSNPPPPFFFFSETPTFFLFQNRQVFFLACPFSFFTLDKCVV